MYVGDYCEIQNPLVLIDRKQDIQEIAANAIGGHKRFKEELDRLKQIGGKMYILIEQDKIDGKPIVGLEDVILWVPPYGETMGERVYRILRHWSAQYNIEFVFCSKRQTGRKIIELLGGERHGEASNGRSEYMVK
jgi:hypothetical protein